MQEAEQRLVLECALLAAYLLLENGAETYRAEETVMRICHSRGMQDVQVMALPTAVFVTVGMEDQDGRHAMRRVTKRTTDLTRIDEVNAVSRRVALGEISLEESIVQLKAMRKSSPGSKWVGMAASALTAGSFAVLFGGGWFDFLVAAVSGFAVQGLSTCIKREDYFHFIISLAGGALNAVIALLAIHLTGMGSMEPIIGGSLMPLLPGLAMTNAIRDTMRGDLVSGVARAAEALLVSVALAAGVGAVLGIRVLIGGVGL